MKLDLPLPIQVAKNILQPRLRPIDNAALEVARQQPSGEVTLHILDNSPNDLAAKQCCEAN